MGSRQEKIEVFDRFLTTINKKYTPDKIYIACNSLSVIYGETAFSDRHPELVSGIVNTGTNLIHTAWLRDQDSGIIIFATPTTIQENTYSANLVKRHVPEEQIVSQACDGLANMISNDPSGLKVEEMLTGFMAQAQEKFKCDHPQYLLYLGCTHYGYRRKIFQAVAEKLSIKARILNPNEFASRDFYTIPEAGGTTGDSRNTSVKFITRYAIPPQEVETLTMFLTPISEETVTALQNYLHIPDLF